MSETELLRLTFPDRGALEREIANNLRYGRIFVGEILKYPVLTDGVIVIVHPVHGRELKLPAQIVMVNPVGPMKGTGLALRAFGPAEVEQVEAFAREVAPAGSGAGARAAKAPVRERPAATDEDWSHLEGQRGEPPPQPRAAKASRADDDWSDLAEPQPQAASERFGHERTTGSIPQPRAARGTDPFGHERPTGTSPQPRAATPQPRAAGGADPFGHERPTGTSPQPRAATPRPRAARSSDEDSSRDKTRAQSPAMRPKSSSSASNDFSRDHTVPAEKPAARARSASSATRPAVEEFSRDRTLPEAPDGGRSARTIVNPGTRPATGEFSRDHAPPGQLPSARGRPPSGGGDFSRDDTLPAQSPAERARGDGRGRAADEISRGHTLPQSPAPRERAMSPVANRAMRPATEVNEARGFDPERTASIGNPTARARSSTQMRPATEVSSPQPSAARPRPGSGAANATVRPATEVVAARARVEREFDPSSQPTATMARPGSSPATPVASSAAQPVRGATAASSVANAALRAPVAAEDDWSDFEHGPEPAAANPPPSRVANTNAVPTAPPPPAAAAAIAATAVEHRAAPRATVEEDDWSDFEHGPVPSAATPAPAGAGLPAPAAVLAEPEPIAVAAARGDEDDWSDFEHGPEPRAVETAAGAADPVAAEGESVTSAAVVSSPLKAAPAAGAAADDWSDFEHGPEPSGAPPSSAAELAPPSAAEIEDDERLVLPLGLGGPAIGSDANNAVTIRPAPSDDTLSALVERSRAEDEGPAEASSSSEDEQAQFDEDPNFEPEERNPDLQSTNRQERLRSLNVVEQLKIARRGELADRVVIERIYGKTVWEALLQNPRITLPEVARIARKGTVPRPLLDIILENGTWLRDMSVRRALLSNPKITGESILKLLRMTPKHELKIMEKGNAYSMAVRDAVKKLLKE